MVEGKKLKAFDFRLSVFGAKRMVLGKWLEAGLNSCLTWLGWLSLWLIDLKSLSWFTVRFLFQSEIRNP